MSDEGLVRRFLMKRDATFSPDRKYRYTLWRRWGNGKPILWVMLNPSTADENVDDPTIRKVIKFTQLWGHDGAVITNLFAYRSTDPDKLRDVPDPIGPSNDASILECVKITEYTVIAWGQTRRWSQDRADFMLKSLPDPIYHLGATKLGDPKHPLYVAYNTTKTRWIRP